MIRDHRYYEKQCAMATAAYLTDAEWTELREHVSECGHCREYVSDIARISLELFFAQGRRFKRQKAPAGMQDRFTERASTFGIPLGRSTSARKSKQFHRLALIAIGLALTVALGLRVFTVSGTTDAPPPISSPVRAQLASSPDVAPQAQAKRSSFRHRYAGANTRLRSSKKSPADRVLWSERVGDRHFAFGFNGQVASPLKEVYIARLPVFDRQLMKGEQRFYLDPQLASLAVLSSPLESDAESSAPRLNFHPPIFRLDPGHNW